MISLRFSSSVRRGKGTGAKTCSRATADDGRQTSNLVLLEWQRTAIQEDGEGDRAKGEEHGGFGIIPYLTVPCRLDARHIRSGVLISVQHRYVGAMLLSRVETPLWVVQRRASAVPGIGSYYRRS